MASDSESCESLQSEVNVFESTSSESDGSVELVECDNDLKSKTETLQQIQPKRKRPRKAERKTSIASECSSTSSTSGCKSKPRQFRSAWIKAYDWLKHNEEDNKMYCLLCTNAKKRSIFTYPGCSRLRIDVVKEHASTKVHHEAVEEAKLQRTTARYVMSAIQLNKDGVYNMFDIMYTIAKEDLAILKLDSLSNLVERCGGSVLSAYRNGHSANEVLQCLAEAMRNALVCSVNKEMRYSLLVDESTDVSIHKQLIMYIFFPTPNGPCNQYLLINELADGTAITTHQSIVRELRALGLNINHMIGFASDGASVMVGKTNGVAAKLKASLPHLISIHCIAHRLSLASLSAADRVPAICTYSYTLKDIYNYLAHSSNRRAELEFWQGVYEDCMVTMKNPSPTRWLSMHNSVTSIAKSYSSLVAFFQLESLSSVAAAGIFNRLKMWKFAAYTFFLQDVLGSLTHLSKNFQKDNMPLPRLLSNVEATKQELHAFYLSENNECTLDGVHLPAMGKCFNDWCSEEDEIGLRKESNDEQDFFNNVTLFVSEIISSLNERFPATNIIKAVQIFDPSNIPSSIAKKVKYGDSAVKELSLSIHIETELAREIFDEWTKFKFEDFSHTLDVYIKSPWAFYENYATSYPKFCHFAQHFLLLPTNTASCERGFSKMKLIKTDTRNHLQTRQLNNLMMVSLSANKREEIIPKAVALWEESKRRYFSKKGK